MAQINPTVGDLSGNVRLLVEGIREARKAKADLIAFPELALTGYPPEDLILKPQFLADTRRALQTIVKEVRGLAAVVGYVSEAAGAAPRSDLTMPGRHALHNAAAIIADGRLVHIYAKRHLPNYGVFDENRYFKAGTRVPIVMYRGTALGVNICEDIWFPEGPARLQAAAGAELIVNINASPFHIGKSRFREQMLATRARENGVIVTYTNMVGGQDELIFDGNSLILDETGDPIVRGKAFEEDFLVADLRIGGRRAAPIRKRWTAKSLRAVDRVTLKAGAAPSARPAVQPASVPLLPPLDEVYRGLVLGVRDYVRKNRFKSVVIGLSGGIDSALTAVIAADALGSANVLGLFMPSPYTSRESREDAVELGRRLGITVTTIAIEELLEMYLRSLTPHWAGRAANETEENLQARIRGNILMAFSNKFGHLVLTTGNKSEMSVGYATLYGDMAGGFAVIKDVSKTMVYDLARLRNGARGPIPKRVFDRAPTAELRHDQKDEDSLPPYSILDPILRAYVEEDRAPEEIVAMGFARDTVQKVIALVDKSEYKRRQAPIGIKITHRALGKDRRMPVTNRYETS